MRTGEYNDTIRACPGLDDITKLTRRAPADSISKAKTDLINVMLRNATCRMRTCI
jgi:hypothetical protein